MFFSLLIRLLNYKCFFYLLNLHHIMDFFMLSYPQHCVNYWFRVCQLLDHLCQLLVYILSVTGLYLSITGFYNDYDKIFFYAALYQDLKTYMIYTAFHTDFGVPYIKKCQITLKFYNFKYKMSSKVLNVSIFGVVTLIVLLET